FEQQSREMLKDNLQEIMVVSAC
ncbi:MAG: hypothetical protein RLZZ262_2519, partial [Bacteroidota bacterium]